MILPAQLEILTLGDQFDQSMSRVKLPEGLQHLRRPWERMEHLLNESKWVKATLTGVLHMHLICVRILGRYNTIIQVGIYFVLFVGLSLSLVVVLLDHDHY